MTSPHAAIKPIFKYMRPDATRIYDLVFILHSKCTLFFLLTFTVILSAKQFFGTPIQCTSDYNKLQEYLTSYCWTMGTYIVMNQNSKLLIAEGVGPEYPASERHYLHYYQWVVLLLLLQAFLFHLPAFLWKVLEGKLLEQLCAEVDAAIVSNEIMTTRRILLTEYFAAKKGNIHFFYMVKYIACEVLNLIVTLLNFVILEFFFDDFWLRYYKALDVVLSNNWNTWNAVISKTFPKVAKCDLSKIGASGSINKIDALCMLPLNVFNEKIFLFLWFWFIIIGVLVAMKLIYRIIILNSKFLRYLLLCGNLRNINNVSTKILIDNLAVGDWFILYRISGQINPLLYRELIETLSLHYEGELNNASSV